MKRQRDLSKIFLGVLGALVLLAGVWHTANLRAENRLLRDRIARYESPAAAASPSSAARSAKPGAKNNPRALHDEAREILYAALSAATGKQVWFVTQVNDPEADLFQRELENTFLESGWEIAGSTESKNSLRAGIRVFVATDELAEHISIVVAGLRAAGFEVFAGTGYRAFYERQIAKDPNFSGVELMPEQDFVIVVGPNPPAP
ncbi:MAG: hypothetical protein OEV00_09110 [Acidobacteriota bacterium]|nr:hypothetical protein [Acidobacteriota bacterium]MDH3785469.1 hypothetical protein [Acidobacteriota bacterium]